MTPERYAQVKRVFLAAGECDGGQRQDVLDRECGGDTELRAEVESLLAHDRSQTLLCARLDTLSHLASATPVAPVRGTLQQKLRTLGLLTRQLGPRGHLAIGGLIACVLIAALGWAVDAAIRSAQRNVRAELLNKLVDTKAVALELWTEQETAKVESFARDMELRRLIEQLAELAADSTNMREDLKKSPLQQSLREELQEVVGRDVKYAAWDGRYRTIADWSPAGDGLGDGVTADGAAVLTRVFQGQTVMQLPGVREPITKNYPLDRKQQAIGMLTPVRGNDGTVMAALLVYGLGAENRFNLILSTLRFGETGETYAFNRNGLMISESRFPEQLRRLGLIRDGGDGRSSLAVELRDPGGDLTRGFRPSQPLATHPLTKMARHATAGQAGADVDGYRGYRGVVVVGAWRWLEALEFGIATEVDREEIDRPVWFLKLEAWGVFGLFAACCFLLAGSYYSILRLRYQIGQSRRVGQYTLEEKIGEGGMGQVYKAHHALLKRPVAIKLLKPELVDRENIVRFEREAQSASRLTHPNTIAIYDYGVTADGAFYYVMEYVAGRSLDSLVASDGPLPRTRAVHLLRQVCYSLREAHALGLVHRDLKPQNIMVSDRGGDIDVVKVLDFGLVKDITAPDSDRLTTSSVVAGTPLYIAPERLRDPRDNTFALDIYSWGAVAFFVLTGREVFQGVSVADLFYQVLNCEPPRPSQIAGVEIPAELDQLVLACLAKTPEQRPPSIIAVLERLP